MWALQHFDVYVGGGVHPVVVYSDHNPLTFLHSLQSPSQRLMRWTLFLQPYNLCIQIDEQLPDGYHRPKWALVGHQPSLAPTVYFR